MASLILFTLNMNTIMLYTCLTFTSTLAVTFMQTLNYTRRYPLRVAVLAVFALALPK